MVFGGAVAKLRQHPMCHTAGKPCRSLKMSKLLRGLAAGWGANKLGGGCFTTVLIFVLLWWLLGNFDIFK
jgi:hypothetical protein